MPAERTPRTILVTGFGPFAEFETNPAWESVRLLDGTRIGRSTIRTAKIDVVYATAATQLEAAIRATSPDVVLSLGVATRPEIRLETLARNRDACPSADNAGERRLDQPIRAGAPDHPSRLPVERILDTLREEGFPVRTSDDAGGYLCNHLFFRLMDGAPDVRVAGFVHVPALVEPWNLERLRAAVRRILEVLAGESP